MIQRSEGLRVIKEKYSSAATIWQLGKSFIRCVLLCVKECLQKLILNTNMADLHFMKNYEEALESVFFLVKT